MTEPFNEFEHFLYSLKLGKHAAKAYITLLEHGPQDRKGLLNHSGVPTSRVPSILKTLKDEGWITTMNNSPEVFCAIYPEKPLMTYLLDLEKWML